MIFGHASSSAWHEPINKVQILCMPFSGLIAAHKGAAHIEQRKTQRHLGIRYHRDLHSKLTTEPGLGSDQAVWGRLWEGVGNRVLVGRGLLTFWIATWSKRAMGWRPQIVLEYWRMYSRKTSGLPCNRIYAWDAPPKFPACDAIISGFATKRKHKMSCKTWCMQGIFECQFLQHNKKGIWSCFCLDCCLEISVREYKLISVPLMRYLCYAVHTHQIQPSDKLIDLALDRRTYNNQQVHLERATTWHSWIYAKWEGSP